MTGPSFEVEPEAGALAQTIAAHLLEEIAGVQAAGRIPSIVLTGGTIAARAYRAAAETAGRHEIDWRRVELWWGDERFVPGADADRNDGQARAALLDSVGVNPDRVHPMPTADDGYPLDEAAAAYADELARAVGGSGAPVFDLVLLGMGPDGHVASLFPGYSALDETRLAAVGVERSPKPPPQRITLTYPILNRARKVWFLVSGAEKAEAVRRAVSGDSVARTPAAGVRGTEQTAWLLDADAASSVPT